MLHAILLNKAGRSLGNNEVNWRHLFSASEDSLTSSIFGNLFYLPINLFWEILNESCYKMPLTKSYPKIISFEFWPHWSANESYNARFIEPDIFIRTEEFDLIIEAKRYDYNQQSLYQWRNEFQGYLNEFGEETIKKKVILLAIGGIDNEIPEPIELHGRTITVIKCRWMNLLSQITQTINSLKKESKIIITSDSSLIILQDIIKGFEIHGYSVGTWFENDGFYKHVPIASSNLSSFFKF